MTCTLCGSASHTVSGCPWARQRGFIASDLLAKIGASALVALVLVGAGWGLRAKYERYRDAAVESASLRAKVRRAENAIDAKNERTAREDQDRLVAAAVGDTLNRMRMDLRAAERRALESAGREREAATRAGRAYEAASSRSAELARDLAGREAEVGELCRRVKCEFR